MITIVNDVTSLALQDFTGETFIFNNQVHLVLDHIVTEKGIACFNYNIPDVVFLQPDSKITPANVEIVYFACRNMDFNR